MTDEPKRSGRFASVRRGYDPAEVDRFLVSIASRIDALETAIQKHRATSEPGGAGSAAPAGLRSDERYTERAARLGLVGEREVEKMVAEAKEDAARIVSEARAEADRMISAAQGEAQRFIAEGRAFLAKVEQEAEAVSSGIQGRHQQMTEELRGMQEYLLRVVQELNNVLNPGAGSSQEI